MTNRENYASIARRTGYKKMPADFNMCASLKIKFQKYCQETGFNFNPSVIDVPDVAPASASRETFLKYYDVNFKEGTHIDEYGVAHEPGSEAAYHMTKMHFPLEKFTDVEQILEYPFPNYTNADISVLENAVKKAHENDLVAIGDRQCTVWERAWYMRGMENLMVDMMMDDPIAEALLNKVTDLSVARATRCVKSGVDVLFLGDDIGTQRSLLMSEELYCKWIKPRLKRVIDTARAINPNIIIFYHSCGYVTPMIPHLIEAGIDVLNPVQPECMNFEEIHEMYGDKLSFHGTIGTQTTMPFATPLEVKRTVWRNLEIAGEKGGLFVAPTHLLEPEVPVENIVAYIQACEEFK